MNTEIELLTRALEAAKHKIFVHDDLSSHGTRLEANMGYVKALSDLEAFRKERKTIAPPCEKCGGAHDFDTSIPSEDWNAVIRANTTYDYLCLNCIVKEFGAANHSFTAKLYGDAFDGIPTLSVFFQQPSTVTISRELVEEILRIDKVNENYNQYCLTLKLEHQQQLQQALGKEQG